MNLAKYRNQNQDLLYRLIWTAVWVLLIKWLPRKYPKGWYNFWLRIFGAKLSNTSTIYNSARIYNPRNLIVGAYSTISDRVIVYSVAKIELGDNVLVSQGCHLCSATHDYRANTFDLLPIPIQINADSWIASEVFIGPGVNVGEGVIIGARAVVVKSVRDKVLIAGNPAKIIRNL